MGEILEQLFRLGFKASKNEAEYEALLARFRLARGIRVDHIKAYSDSQLVVNQFSGEFKPKTNDGRLPAVPQENIKTV